MQAPERGVRDGEDQAHVTTPAIPTGRVLLVEDDLAVRSLLDRSLALAGFSVSSVPTLAEARVAAACDTFDLAVIDLGLPDGDGLDLVRELADKGEPRTIALSGRASEGERILGLQMGADDYITKPFSPRELVARAISVLRRASTQPEPARVVDYGWLRLDLEARMVWVDCRETALTRMEFDLLVALATRPRRVCTRAELMEWVWNAPGDAGARTITEHVRRVRQKLGDDSDDGGHIVSVRGVGYRFDP